LISSCQEKGNHGHQNPGKIFKQQSTASNAEEQYEKFADLKRETDIRMAEVEDVRKRLAAGHDRAAMRELA
jgi:hypothetical protein